MIMKANEAPEKIYIQSFNVIEEDAKFNKSKMFFDDVWTEEPELGQENIEYLRKDVFIEKACKWLKENITNNPNANSVLVRNGCVTLGMLVDDFKKYMEG